MQRSFFNAGDILFVRGRSVVSPLIRYFDKGGFSHVAIAVSNTHIIEAQRFTEVRIVPNKYPNAEVVRIGLSGSDTDNLLRWAISMCGKRYDYTQIFSYVLNHYFETGIWNNPKNVICSELVAKFLVEFGRLDQTDDVFNLKPNELYEKVR